MVGIEHGVQPGPGAAGHVVDHLIVAGGWIVVHDDVAARPPGVTYTAAARSIGVSDGPDAETVQSGGKADVSVDRVGPRTNGALVL